MFEYIAQNFNLVSFSLALAFFLTVSAIGRVLTAYLKLYLAKKNAAKAQAKLAEYQQKLQDHLTGIRQGIGEIRNGPKPE